MRGVFKSCPRSSGRSTIRVRAVSNSIENLRSCLFLSGAIASFIHYRVCCICGNVIGDCLGSIGDIRVGSRFCQIGGSRFLTIRNGLFVAGGSRNLAVRIGAIGNVEIVIRRRGFLSQYIFAILDRLIGIISCRRGRISLAVRAFDGFDYLAIGHLPGRVVSYLIQDAGGSLVFNIRCGIAEFSVAVLVMFLALRLLSPVTVVVWFPPTVVLRLAL